MLKYLYKTLVIAFISGSLTFQSTAAMAQAVSTDRSGTSSKTKQYHFDEVKEDNIMASITMIVGGLIIARMLYNYRPATGDVMVAAAAGVAFIAGEIMSNSKFKGKMDAMTAEVTKKSNREVNEEQVKRLQDLKKSYEEAKTTTEQKKKMQMAAATALGVSTVWAIVANSVEKSKAATCTAGLAAKETVLTECIAAGEAAKLTIPVGTVAVADGEACKACQAQIVLYTTASTKYLATRELFNKSSLQAKNAVTEKSAMTAAHGVCATASAIGGPQSKAVAAAWKAACAPYELWTTVNETHNLIGVQATNQNQDLLKLLNLPLVEHMAYEDSQSQTKMAEGFTRYFENALNVLFPKVQASSLAIGGLVGGAILALIPSLGTFVDGWMFTPLKRSIVFGVLAGTAALAAKASADVIEDLDKHIQKIDTILADINAMAAGVKTQNITNQAVKIQTIKAGSSGSDTYTPDGTGKMPCMTGNSSENCPKLTDQLTNMPGFANLPESFRNIASQSIGLGESLSGSNGVSGSAMSTAENIGNNHAAISRMLKKQQTKVAKLSNGKIDFAKEEQKFLQGAGAVLKKELKRKGMTAAGMLASIGASPIGSPSSDKADKKEGTLAKTAPAAAAGAVDISASGDGKEDETLKLEFNEEKTEPVDYAMGGAGGGQDSADMYDVKTNEISKEDGPSLFEVISKRYFKSGYPKLLEEVPSKQ